MRKSWDAVLSTAARQHGAVSAEQLRACRFSAKSRRAAVASGRLIQVEATVYVVGGSADTWHRRLQIALLAVPGSWVSHEAAAALMRFDRTRPGPVEITAPRAKRRRKLRHGALHTTALVGPHDVITIAGLRCASATRTILDLAAVGTGIDRLGAMMDSAVAQRRTAPKVLAQRLATLRGSGRRGVALVERMLLDSGGETPLERKFLELMRTGGLPRPTTQHRIRRSDGRIARVDFIYDAARLVVEVTGRRGHSSPRERQLDAQRRNELADLGFRVTEYTWEDLRDRPDYVTSTMRTRLTALHVA